MALPARRTENKVGRAVRPFSLASKNGARSFFSDTL
jgi:hypothetical protein